MTDRSGLGLFLVRHGATDWNEDGRLMGRNDVDLNERGRGQAHAVAEALVRACASPFDSTVVEGVYSSPQVRARHTAAPIAEAFDVRVQVEPAFDEVWLSDDWKGKTVAELRGDDDLEQVIANPTYVCDALEPLEKVRDRTVAAIEALRKARTVGAAATSASGSTSIVIVSHGDPLRAIVAHYLGLGLEGIRRFAIDNGSLTSLRFGTRGARLRFLNLNASVMS